MSKDQEKKQPPSSEENLPNIKGSSHGQRTTPTPPKSPVDQS
jgi:hypothetical protein